MLKIQEVTNQEKLGTFKKFIPPVIADKLHHLAFLNSLQATFIVAIRSKKIITGNKTFGNHAVIPEGNYQQKKNNLFI